MNPFGNSYLPQPVWVELVPKALKVIRVHSVALKEHKAIKAQLVHKAIKVLLVPKGHKAIREQPVLLVFREIKAIKVRLVQLVPKGHKAIREQPVLRAFREIKGRRA
jgi:hypothetical protein